MKKLITLTIILFSLNIKAQTTMPDTIMQSFGLIYCNGISWTENKKNDVKIIIIHIDTMKVIRNLLIYLLEQKEKADAADNLLSMINLDFLNKTFGSKDFDFLLKDYKKIIRKENIKEKNFKRLHHIE